MDVRRQGAGVAAVVQLLDYYGATGCGFAVHAFAAQLLHGQGHAGIYLLQCLQDAWGQVHRPLQLFLGVGFAGSAIFLGGHGSAPAGFGQSLQRPERLKPFQLQLYVQFFDAYAVAKLAYCS